MDEEFLERERRYREARGLALVRQRAGEVGARLQQVDHDEAKQQRDEGGGDEPAQRLGEDAAELGAGAHMGDAADERSKHQRRDDHLDQAQEQHRDQVDARGDLGPAVGKKIEDQGSHHDAKDHREQDVLRKPVGHCSYPRKFRLFWLRQPKVCQICKATQYECGDKHACQNVPVVNSPHSD
jgi:hypothetical protein